MLKFKYDYQKNTLAYQKPNLDAKYWHQINEHHQFTYFNKPGFKLEKGWITFTLYPDKIYAFYKQFEPNLIDFEAPQTITYFSRDLPKEAPVIFIFVEADQVEKIGNSWVKKGGNHE